MEPSEIITLSPCHRQPLLYDSRESVDAHCARCGKPYSFAELGYVGLWD